MRKRFYYRHRYDSPYDGFSRTRDSVKDLMEGLPKTYDNKHIHPLVNRVIDTCLKQDWVKDVRVRMREHGMVFFGDIVVIPTDEKDLIERIQALDKELEDLDWKIKDVVVSPVKQFRHEEE